MKKIFIFLIILLSLALIGCNNEQKELYEIIDDYRYSNEISYTIKNNGNDFTFNSHMFAQCFIEYLYLDVPLKTYNNNYKYKYDKQNKRVEIIAKNDSGNELFICIYSDGSIYLDNGEHKYIGKKKTIDYSLFTTIENINNLISSYDFKYSYFNNDDIQMKSANYIDDSLFSNDPTKYSLDNVINKIKKLIKTQKEKGIDPGINFENIFLNHKNDIYDCLTYYQQISLDEKINAILKDYQLLYINYPYFDKTKISLKKYILNISTCEFHQIDLNDSNESKIYIYGTENGGLLYNQKDDKLYVIAKKDMNEIEVKLINACHQVNNEIDVLKESIVGWWNS